MSWNHRVIKKRNGGEVSPDETYYNIHDVYYDEAKQPYTWSKEPSVPHGETPEELKKDLLVMLEAFRKPILEEVKEGDEERLKQI